MQPIRLIALLFVLLSFAGCSTVAPPPVSQLPRSYHADIALGGRLSVRYEQEGKPQSVQGKFSWSQKGEMTEIALYSPLGQTMAKIALAPGVAMLEQAGRPAQRAADVSELTTQALGWPLPVAGLRDWLQGYARDARGAQLAMVPDASSTFESDGWRVSYVSWQSQAGFPAYPKRIDMERHTAEAGQIGLRIVIDSWQPK